VFIKHSLKMMIFSKDSFKVHFVLIPYVACAYLLAYKRFRGLEVM
jgi:hypothetical protein